MFDHRRVNIELGRNISGRRRIIWFILRGLGCISGPVRRSKTEVPDDTMRNKESIRESDAVGAVIKKGGACGGPKDRKEDSRRSFLKGSVGLVAGAAAAQLLPGGVATQQKTANAATLESLTNAKGRPILLKDGIVLSMDRQVGDFPKADVLIQGKKISAVGPNLSAPTQAVVVNAAGMIVMPGFVDTHHHQFETPLRSILSDGLLGTLADTVNSYQKTILGTFAPAYLPEDARLGELVASLSQITRVSPRRLTRRRSLSHRSIPTPALPG